MYFTLFIGFKVFVAHAVFVVEDLLFLHHWELILLFPFSAESYFCRELKFDSFDKLLVSRYFNKIIKH